MVSNIRTFAGGVLEQIPNPTGPAAPAALVALANKALNFGWWAVLVCCFAMALWGFGSLAYASKKQQFGGVNEGKKLIVMALSGAAGVTVLRALFTFFGV